MGDRGLRNYKMCKLIKSFIKRKSMFIIFATLLFLFYVVTTNSIESTLSPVSNDELYLLLDSQCLDADDIEITVENKEKTWVDVNMNLKELDCEGDETNFIISGGGSIKDFIIFKGEDLIKNKTIISGGWRLLIDLKKLRAGSNGLHLYLEGSGSFYDHFRFLYSGGNEGGLGYLSYECPFGLGFSLWPPLFEFKGYYCDQAVKIIEGYDKIDWDVNRNREKKQKHSYFFKNNLRRLYLFFTPKSRNAVIWQRILDSVVLGMIAGLVLLIFQKD